VLPEKIYLVDRTAALVAAWSEAFEGFSNVSCTCGDYFSIEADAMLSPANSFGIMDGGLDLAIRDALGFQVQEVAQRAIIERHHGELHVGEAEIVPTNDKRWPFLVVAPTMRVPENISQTVNAYVAFRAALLAVRRHNAAGHPVIRTMLCPGLGTGIGCLEPRRCAAQMRVALKQVSDPPRIPSFDGIRTIHRALRSA
jgi:O-acetyl-ADP-ribose deacetylase (regulator of RNase III)